MFDGYIVLGDNTTVQNAKCVESNGKLFVYCEGMDIRTGFDLFISTTRAGRITAFNGTEVVGEYNGYSTLYAISAEYGNANVVLQKG